MMIEQQLLNAMTSAAQNREYFIACAYALTYAKFLDVPSDKIPSKPMENTSIMITQEKWQTYYFQLLMSIVDKMKDTLKDVRVRYGKGRNTPTVIPKS